MPTSEPGTDSVPTCVAGTFATNTYVEIPLVVAVPWYWNVTGFSSVVSKTW